MSYGAPADSLLENISNKRMNEEVDISGRGP